MRGSRRNAGNIRRWEYDSCREAKRIVAKFSNYRSAVTFHVDDVSEVGVNVAIVAAAARHSRDDEHVVGLKLQHARKDVEPGRNDVGRQQPVPVLIPIPCLSRTRDISLSPRR